MKGHVIVAAMGMLCIATSASAQGADDQLAVYGCQNAAIEAIRTPMPESMTLNS